MPKRFRQLSERLRRNREFAIQYANAASSKRLVSLLEKAQAELEKRLTQTAGLVGPQGEASFSHVHAAIAKRQVEEILIPLQKGISNLIVDGSETVAEHAATSSLEYMKAAEDAFTGIGAASAPKLHEARILDHVVSGTEASVLRRLATSGEPGSNIPVHSGKRGILYRYGESVIESFEEELQLRFVANKSWAETRNVIIDRSPFLTVLGREGVGKIWAERIVRTELMATHNRANWETIKESNKVLGDSVKILSATFDNRTAADSYAVHGQIRRIDEPFNSWFGSYMHPPNRPNDREIVVPHRLSWPIPDSLRWKTDEEVMQAWLRDKRKLPVPPRPKMTTIPIEEFGKPQPLPKVEPTEKPTEEPTEKPTEEPTEKPKRKPKRKPTEPKETEPEFEMVDGERLPKLGPGLQWQSSEQILLEDTGKKPEGMGLVPWGIVGTLDIGKTGDVARALRTLRVLPGGSYMADIGSLEPLGFDVPDPKKLNRIRGQLEKITSLDLHYTRTELDELVDNKSQHITRERLQLDRLTFLKKEFSLFGAKDYIDNPDVSEKNTGIVTVKRGDRYYVISGNDRAASQRLLGKFDDEVVVIDLDKRLPKPKTRQEFIDALPDSLSTSEQRSAFRTMIQDWFANDGLVSHDIGQYRSGAYNLEFKPLPPTVAGYHHWTGEIEVDDSTGNKPVPSVEQIERTIADLKAGRVSNLVDLTTFLHEEAHGHSPCSPRAYRESGAGIEEATTELYARKKWRELLNVVQPSHTKSFDELDDPTISKHEMRERLMQDAKSSFDAKAGYRPIYTDKTWIDEQTGVYTYRTGKRWRDDSNGSYKRYIIALYEQIHKATGLHADAIPDLVDNIIIRFKSGKASETYNNPEAFIRAFVGSIDGAEAIIDGERKPVKFGAKQRNALVKSIMADSELKPW